MKKEEILGLIKTGEGLTVEFKESVGSNLGKEICAFANAKGGKILLGINDKGEIAGIKRTNLLESNIQSFARNMDPAFSVEVESVEDIIVIHVPEGKEKPYSINGQFFLRIGTNSQQLNRDEIREFFQKENLILFDNQPNIQFDLNKDLDEHKFKNFLRLARITDNLDKTDILRNLFLLDGEYMKNAGVLFFCHRVTKFFVQGIATCVLYEGKSRKSIIDKKDFDADMLSNYENAYDFIASKLNTNYIIGREREERLELPKDAIREALINAFIHRDYFSTGHVQVDIFIDRVEISNPGGLVKGLTEKDFGKASLPRNPLLMDLMLRAEKVERVGSGIGRIKEGMEQYDLGVNFEISSDWFRVIFNRRLQGEGLSEGLTGTLSGTLSGTLNDTLFCIKKNPGIQANQISKILKRPIDTVKKQVKHLADKGLIIRKGSRKTGGYWIANEN